jgi:hypothetical protein
MKREFMIERQGRSFVLYAGLLNEAHQQGLKAIRTHLLQIPSLDNGNTAICFAEVETERGTFTGIGDASPDNVARVMSPHIIRMAETRAKARAMRDSINVGVVAVEELGELDDVGTSGGLVESREAVQSRPVAVERVTNQITEPRPPLSIRNDFRTPAPIDRGGLATLAQVRALYLIGRNQLGLSDAEFDERSVSLHGAPPAELTKKQASDLITSLKSGGATAAAR